MNNITKPAGTALADDAAFAQQLLGGLQESRTVVMATGGGKPLLRMLKTGEWVFGQGDDPVQEGSHWAVNVRTLGWGSVCWTNYPSGQKNKRLGLVVAPMTQHKPPTPAPLEGFPFTDYVTFDLLCLDGDDEGLEVTYGTSSIGGLRAFTKLRDAIIAQLQRDPATPCPVLTLGEESYKGNYGKIFNPILTITGWADLNGVAASPEGAAVARTAAAPAAAEPVRKRKAPLAATLGATEEAATYTVGDGEDAGPVSTQQAHTGQRRRHRPAA